MSVTMVQVRYVRMIVNEGHVPVRMRVRLTRSLRSVVLVAVMLVVHVRVVVLDFLVRV